MCRLQVARLASAEADSREEHRMLVVSRDTRCQGGKGVSRMVEVYTSGHAADGHVKCCNHTTDNHGSLQTAGMAGSARRLV